VDRRTTTVAAANVAAAMTNPLEGRPLRYLIGGNDSYPGRSDEVVELSYDARKLPAAGIGIKYCNLFLEKYGKMTAAERAAYAPYLPDDDVSSEYEEGRIDPAGQGWDKNLSEQFTRAHKQGFTIVELDNPDSYRLEDVLDAVQSAASFGLDVLAKNPMMVAGDHDQYVAHPAVVGVIVEKDCGTPEGMNVLRQCAGKPTLPVWFVAFGSGRAWADRMAQEIVISEFYNMSVTYSSLGEYGNSTDIVRPVAPNPQPEQPTIEIKTTGSVRVIVNGIEINS
jgi:hypothetical protein